MSLGEQKEQRGRGGRGWWQQHKLGGTVEGQKCAGLLAFLLEPKKTKGVRASPGEADDFQPCLQSVSVPLEC